LPICCYTSDIDVAIAGAVPVPVLPISPTPVAVRNQEEEEDEDDQDHASHHETIATTQDQPSRKERRKQERMKRWLLALEEIDRANETAQGVTATPPPPTPTNTTESGQDEDSNINNNDSHHGIAIDPDHDDNERQGDFGNDKKKTDTSSATPATGGNSEESALNEGGQIDDSSGVLHLQEQVAQIGKFMIRCF
jgi:hypothetical protein